MSVSVLFAGGGTGGHVFPLLAIAESVRAAAPDARVTFVGTASGMEASILPPRGEALELLEVLPIKGMGVRGALRGVGQAFKVLPAASALIKRVNPDVVLSIGGYAAGPVSLAARTMGIPLALLEPNCVLGMANHILTPIASRAYVVFPEVERKFRPSVVRSFGLPIRQGFEPSRYAPVEGKAEVLVLGGSQGAKALNEVVPDAIARLVSAAPSLRVLHQVGKGKDAETRARYEALGLADRAEVVPFLDDMPARIAQADVIVGRAGAGAIAEICAIGRAAVYVPFPFAADDHQRRNAQALSDAGAAVCVPQKDASVERVEQELLSLLRSPERRAQMAAEAAKRGRPSAADEIAADLLALAERTAAKKRRSRGVAGDGASMRESALCFEGGFVTSISWASAASA